jgi:hypothetical protein
MAADQPARVALSSAPTAAARFAATRELLMRHKVMRHPVPRLRTVVAEQPAALVAKLMVAVADLMAAADTSNPTLVSARRSGEAPWASPLCICGAF